MRYILLVAFWATLASCRSVQTKSPAATLASSPYTEQIDDLIRRINKSMGLWMNGGLIQIDLPNDALEREVVAEALRERLFEQGYVQSHRIAAIGQVRINDVYGFDDDLFSAAVLETDLGPTVVIFKYSAHWRWFCRFYPLNNEWAPDEAAIEEEPTDSGV